VLGCLVGAELDKRLGLDALIERHLNGSAHPTLGNFRCRTIVTTLTRTNRAVVRVYTRRGTAEQWIKEGKTATHWTPLLSSLPAQRGAVAARRHPPQPRQSAARLVLPFAISSRSLTSLQRRLLKTGGCLIRHARYFILQLAESLLTPTLFRQILRLVNAHDERCAARTVEHVEQDRTTRPSAL